MKNYNTNEVIDLHENYLDECSEYNANEGYTFYKSFKEWLLNKEKLIPVKGQMIWVKHNSAWLPRIFSHFEEDEIGVFCSITYNLDVFEHWPEYSLTNPTK